MERKTTSEDNMKDVTINNPQDFDIIMKALRVAKHYYQTESNLCEHTEIIWYEAQAEECNQMMKALLKWACEE